MFLSLVLTQTFHIIQDLIHIQDEYAKLKKAVRSPLPLFPRDIDARDQAASNSRGNVVADDQTKEIERLKKDLGQHLSLVIGYILMISIHIQRR